MRKMFGQSRTWVAVLLTVCMLLLTACGAGSEIDTRPAKSEEEAALTQAAKLTEAASQVTNTPSVTPTPEVDLGEIALQELIEILKEAEYAVDESYRKINDDTGETYDKVVHGATIMKETSEQLREMKARADKIPNLDANIRSAAGEYFEMVIFSRESLQEVYHFFEQQLPVYYELIPDADKYSFRDYCDALNNWYEGRKEIIDGITEVPSCVQSEWNNFKRTYELNETIITKAYRAVALNDWLRYYSCQFLLKRFATAEEKDFDALLASLASEVDFAKNQAAVACDLAWEISSCAGIGRDARAGHVFENNRNSKITVDYDAIQTIYPALYNTYNAFVIVKTGCLSGTRRITVEAEIPGYTQKYRQTFTLDASYRAIPIKPPVLTGNVDFSAAKNAQIVVSVFEQDGYTLIDSQSFPVTLKSRNDFEWSSDEYGISTQDNILCYLTPESTAITQLKRTAIDEISAMTNGQMESFAGYQGSQWDHRVITYLEAAGIMRALNVMGVRYNMDPFSLSNSHQHILFPSEVIENRSGLCIETSLVVASALQSAGMHAFLVFPKGHAQVAVETWTGSGEYLLIETTALTSGNNSRQIFIDGANNLINNKYPKGPIEYLTASEWHTYIRDEVEYLVDCDDSTVLGLTAFSN
ncbi:MAG: hypothetical protein IKZ69_00980 [Lachnospiraceae bacterium]|nr:hypothetical protein [Lachnospiraceae bacterium]